MKRRNFLSRLGLTLASIGIPLLSQSQSKNKYNTKMNTIKSIKPLGFQWETADPFLFCVHHEDKFPKGNAEMGPTTSMEGRHMGSDFIIKDGFRMYHGKKVPGFPGHPHRGFETITVVREGLVDHADSMGAAGRYGDGDVQWMTAGKGVQHSEMFPLINEDKENPMELFQIWLNLPRKNKMVEPHFKMLWKEIMPIYKEEKTTIEIIAGELNKTIPIAPPPNSWAADKNNEVAVWNITMDANAIFELPKASEGINRTLYYYEGEGLTINNQSIPTYHAIEVEASHPLTLQTTNTKVKILVLQGRPINEPVIQYGPFVMNSKEEIQQAFNDYHETQFGGWPWARLDQVHDRSKGRFAKHADGTIESKS